MPPAALAALRPSAAAAGRTSGRPCSCAFGRATFVQTNPRQIRLPPRPPLDCEGLPVPSSGLWEQAEPGWRSAADTQRAEAGRAEANVKREGMGDPEPV
jgi:hypothetical protein